MESGTLKALNYYLTNQNEDDPGYSFQVKLALGLGAGLTDLCHLMVLKPGDDGYSEILALLYDLSSRIKVPPLIGLVVGGDTLKDIIDFINTTNDPNLLAYIILEALPTIIDPLLG